MELLVSMGLMMLLMGSILAIFQSGARYYNNSTKIVDLQQACLVSANRIGGELSVADLSCIDDTSTTKTYLTFASPINDQGDVTFSEGTTSMLWIKYICYYIEKSNGQETLRRQTSLILPAADAPPTVPTGLDDAYFRSLVPPTPTTPYPSSLIASNIYSLDATRSATGLSLVVTARDSFHEFRISVETTIQPRN